MKLSIIMTYYNRKPQCLKTLESISRTDCQNQFEVIIIDDGSNSQHKLVVEIDRFKYPITLIELKREEKTSVEEPLSVVNDTVKGCHGDIVILQNAECLHAGDVIKHSMRYIAPKMYLSFAAQSVNRNGSFDSWYNHSYLRPTAYPFCCAMFRQDYLDIGGFDERFSQGRWYADDEFVWRVKQKLDVVFVDEPYVIHQFHVPMHPFHQHLKERNRKLFEEIKANESLGNRV